MLRRKNKGFTLIELLVALTISAILISSLIAIYLASAKKSQEALDTTRLDESLQASLTLMANDIRRAGYWGSAETDIGSGANTNPFMTNDITINTDGDCILFTYDTDGDGTLPSIGSGNDDEHYGFRLMGSTIQARPSGAPYSCTADENDWENITDPKVINITQLSFTKTSKNIDIDGSGSGTAAMEIRIITISITGQLVSNPSISKTLAEEVRVRNDKYSP